MAGTTAPSAGLTLNLPSTLSSNNPFRNRATSPSPLNTSFAETPSRMRPTSNNPFFDPSEMAGHPNNSTASGPAKNINIPDDIFGDLSLLEKSSTNVPQRQTPLPGPNRAGTMPQQGQRAPPSEDRRAPPRPPRGPGSPAKRDPRAPPQPQRRASESSIMEKERRPRMDRDRERDRDRARDNRPPRTESEERRRRERRREREERHKREKDKGRTGDKRTKKPQGLDIIDKLDVTGIYGQGLFHHDGPFDACNPHRNAKRDRRAPMQAFPADSANMALGGSGPLNTRLDLDRFHGRGEEGFSEFAATRKAKVAAKIIDPTARIEQVHGEETYGLGTSTFLEGAPASKSALQRRDSEDLANEGGAGGLSRKKSIAQRFRGMSGSRRYPPNGVRSPEAKYPGSSSDIDSPPSKPQIKAVSAGGPARAKYNKENEVNPFENDYEAAFDKKGTQIRIAEQEKQLGTSPSSPRELTRTLTSEGVSRGRGSSNEEDRPSGGGFLNRMRSLKGGPRRVRNDA